MGRGVTHSTSAQCSGEQLTRGNTKRCDSGFLFCLQQFHFLFATHQSFLFVAVPLFVCSDRFLFAADLFSLQRSFFVCSSFHFCLQRFPFFVCSAPVFSVCTGSLFCLERSFFVCSASFFFAAIVLCLQRIFFVSSVSLVGHHSLLI